MPKKRSAIKVRKGVTKDPDKKAKRPPAPAQTLRVEGTRSVVDGLMKPLIRNAFLKRGS